MLRWLAGLIVVALLVYVTLGTTIPTPPLTCFAFFSTTSRLRSWLACAGLGLREGVELPLVDEG